MIVKPSVYVRYYFELHALYKKRACEGVTVPVDRTGEMKLGIVLNRHGWEQYEVNVETRLEHTFSSFPSEEWT